MAAKLKVFVGNFIHSTEEEPMIMLKDTVVGVSDSKIEFIKPRAELEDIKTSYNIKNLDITFMNDRQFMIPGFIDTHIHAPQYPNLGLKIDLPLLEWLTKYTYPTEAKFKDEAYAKKIYPRVVDRLLCNGTTTAAYFASLHLPATKVLIDAVREKGQRALVGKCSLMLHWPDYYREPSFEKSIRDDEDFIKYVRDLKTPLVHPIIAPRFPPTWTLDQMKALGQLAQKYDCHVQSHLAETRPEVELIKNMYPWSENYTDVYERSCLLGPKTFMGHGVWLEDAELKKLKERGTGISHCPNSNISIRSGLCDVRRLLDNGVKVGLGTDCSAGYSVSILDSIRQTLQTSKTLTTLREGYKNLSLHEVFRLATLGGAQVVSLDDQIGNFKKGKDFDALMIDLGVEDSPLDLGDEDTLEDMMERFLLNGDDRNIVQVFVAGNKIRERKH